MNIDTDNKNLGEDTSQEETSQEETPSKEDASTPSTSSGQETPASADSSAKASTDAKEEATADKPAKEDKEEAAGSSKSSDKAASKEETKETAAVVKEVVDDGKNWFVLRVMSGKERKLKDYLENEMHRSGWDKIVTQILVPTEKVFKVVKGKKVTQERNFFPGYILIEAETKKLNGDILQSIRSVTGVINFLGGNKPNPIRQSEVNRILGKVDEMQELGETLNEPFILGETIKIIDGPFSDFNGNIEEVYEEKKKLKVIVLIFGRKTPVELSFMQVEKHT